MPKSGVRVSGVGCAVRLIEMKDVEMTTIPMLLEDLVHGGASRMQLSLEILRDIVARSHDLGVHVSIIVHLFVRDDGLRLTNLRPTDPEFWLAARFALVPGVSSSGGAPRRAALVTLAEQMRACLVKHAGQARVPS